MIKITQSYFSVVFSGASSDDLENLSIIVFHRPFFSSSICCTLPRVELEIVNRNNVCLLYGTQMKCVSVPDKSTLHSSTVTPVKLVSRTRGN